MKRAMRCQTNNCTVAPTIATITIGDAVLARPIETAAPRLTAFVFPTPAVRRVSLDRPPDTPPPRA